MNEKLSFVTVDGRTLPVLFLNGSAKRFPKPWEDLSGPVNILDLPDHSGNYARPLTINPSHINEILEIENPTLEQEATLTAVLSGDTAITMGPFNASRITFSSGLIPMVAALVTLPNFTDASSTYLLPPRLLIVSDYPDLPRN